MTFVWLALSLGIATVLGQQCSNVDLESKAPDVYFQSSLNKFVLSPPNDFGVKHKYVFFIDMSNSMISGPCPQDVNADILFKVFPAYDVYDPNKRSGNRNDHRADGVDCQVNPNLEISWKNISTANPDITATPPTFYQTTLGVDAEGHRLSVVRKWLLNLLASADKETVDSAEVMIVPVSGGVSQRKLNALVKTITKSDSPLIFQPLKDPKVFLLLDLLLEEQNKNISLVKTEDPFRYNDTSMGTSSTGSLIYSLYERVYRDMYDEYKKGKLAETEYDFVQLTDGLSTPTEKMFKDTLDFSARCASCSSTRQTCAGACSRIVADMLDSWGNPLDNQLEMMEYNFGLLQTLPVYFGGGTIRFNFVKMRKDRILALWPSEKPFFDELKPKFEAKKRHINIWDFLGEDAPFRLPGTGISSVSFKLTDLFVLNPSVRFNSKGVLDIDSDGDGLFNSEELALGTNPSVARTNGFCLDGFMKNAAFADRCRAMAISRSCDPSLDSDGDSLNECEEILLGTDPFDFDSDGDSIPDYLEWLYGFNPLVSDQQRDSNGDGVPNFVNFSSGLPPNLTLESVSKDKYVQYDLNNLGKARIPDAKLGSILVDSFQLILKYIPTLIPMPVHPSEQVELFSIRNLIVSNQNVDRLKISPDEQLLPFPKDGMNNQILSLARLIDQDDNSKVFWRIYKVNIGVDAKIIQPELDLSLFKQMRTKDSN